MKVINKNEIAYISYNYGKCKGKTLNLIRLKNSKGLLKTNDELVALGLAIYKK